MREDEDEDEEEEDGPSEADQEGSEIPHLCPQSWTVL